MVKKWFLESFLKVKFGGSEDENFDELIEFIYDLNNLGIVVEEEKIDALRALWEGKQC